MRILIKEVRSISEKNIVDGVGGYSKVDRVKSWANFWVKLATSKL